jgi:orotidine-5'-phosphate decarboxylase
MKNRPLFTEQLAHAWSSQNSMLCVGLDPDPKQFPASIKGKGGAILAFCREIVDATADLVCAFKPQIAYFSAHGAEDQLAQLIDHIHRQHPQVPVILDSKRGDIGSTAQQYAIEAFDRYQADAVTVNPYMGFDSVEPYLKYVNKGVIVLCRTSNPGGSDLQFLEVNEKGQTDKEFLYQRVARLASSQWNKTGQLGLVVGATFPEEIAKVRAIVGEMPLLIPGIGAQGGDIPATVQAGTVANAPGTGMIINSSRAILYASQDGNFADAARQAAIATRDALRKAK